MHRFFRVVSLFTLLRYPKILVASDSFKGSLTSVEACDSIRRGILDACPSAMARCLPISDGGEGFLDAIRQTLPQAITETQPITFFDTHPSGAEIVISENVAYIESSQTLGLYKSENRQQNITERLSTALGEQIMYALHRRVRKIILGLGGSATNDGGIGLLQHLGMRCVTHDGERITLRSLMEYENVTELDFSGFDWRLRDLRLDVLCDVTNPLLGNRGATMMFGAQKGVTERLRDVFEAFLEQFSRHVTACLKDVEITAPGMGAAGGLGFCLAALGGNLVSGSKYMLDALKVSALMQQYDLIITGEGRSDGQTLLGKIPFEIATLSVESHIPVYLLAGDIDKKARKELDAVFTRCMAITELGVTPLQAMNNADFYLRAGAFRAVKVFLRSLSVIDR